MGGSHAGRVRADPQWRPAALRMCSRIAWSRAPVLTGLTEPADLSASPVLEAPIVPVTLGLTRVPMLLEVHVGMPAVLVGLGLVVAELRHH